MAHVSPTITEQVPELVVSQLAEQTFNPSKKGQENQTIQNAATNQPLLLESINTEPD